MGSIELAVGWPDVPAWKLMDALVSLHHNPGGSWGWKGDGSRTKPYTLYCSQRLADLARVKREEPEKIFREEVALSIQGAGLPPEERKKFIEAHPELAARLGNEEMVAGIRAFASLPPEIQEGALQGRLFRISLDQAPEPVKELVRLRVANAKGNAPQTTPNTILIAGTNVQDFTRAVVIQPGQLGSPSYFGGSVTNARIAQGTNTGWDGDADPGLPDGPPKPGAAPFHWTRCWPGQYLAWLSRSYGTPIVSDIVWRSGRSMFPRLPAQPSLRTCLWHAAMMMSTIGMPEEKFTQGTLKQHNGVVLMRDRAWFMNPAYGKVPFDAVETLRGDLAGDKPDAEHVFQAFSVPLSLGPEAFPFLERYFPVLRLGKPALPAVILFSGERKHRSELFSEKGMRISDLGLETQNRLFNLPEEAWGGGPLYEAIRMGGVRVHLTYQLEDHDVLAGMVLTVGNRILPRTPRLHPQNPSLPLFIALDEGEEPDPLPPPPGAPNSAPK